MYFIWGHKATAEVGRDVSTRNGQEDTSLRTCLGIPPPQEGLEGSTAHRMVLQRVSSLPKIQQPGISSLCASQQFWERDFVPWTFPGHPRVKVGPCPGSGISRWADLCSQHLPEPVPVSLAWPGWHRGAWALTPALTREPPKGKATIQLRQEETDQRTDPTSLHPTDPGNQGRKSQGSLTGLTGLNKHLASPVESWIEPWPGRA